MGRSGSSGQRDRKVQPPRPPNAWILYRSFQFRLIRQNNERLSQATVSKRISDMWRNETDDVKRQFEQEAEKKKAEHQALYPDYRFCPQRKEAKKSKKKPKCRDLLAPEDVDGDEDGDDNALPSMPAFPPIPYAHQPQHEAQPFVVHGYPHDVVMPQSFMIPYMPEVHYGPDGPSPPMSTAPSPSPSPSPSASTASHESSASSLQPNSVEIAASSPNPSTRQSSSSQSQASSSSSQLPANPVYVPSLQNSHHSSPNPYATQPLSTLFQSSALGQLPLTSPRPHLRSAENTITPAAPSWNNISSCVPSSHSQNSEEVVSLDIAISQEQSSEPEQSVSPTTPFDSLRGLLSRTDESGVFNLSNIESSEFLNHPQGELEVAMGPEVPAMNYTDELFAEFDFDDFQPQMDPLGECSSSSATFTSSVEDFQSLFHIPDNPEIQAYEATRQRQTSAFMQDMMNFLNFDPEDSHEDTSTIVSQDAVAPTIAPQQVPLQNHQVAAATPIFSQMTNTPIVTSGTSYVPPAGAIYSSTRRVGGSWKPPFAIPHSQMEEPLPSWAL